MAPVIVRKVYEYNVFYEFSLIQQSLSRFRFASLDTEFPGTIYDAEGVPPHLQARLSPEAFYAVMKQNVDALNLIQLGLTLSDSEGNLPTLGTRYQYVWEFNFRDFDYESDLHDPEAITMLERQGMDFPKNKRMGIDSSCFAVLFRFSGLCFASYGKVTWVTFHGPYDFGYLIKILTGGDLPGDIDVFLDLVREFFGPAVYDVKSMIRFFGLYGGLERVARSLKLERVAGKSHQAGSDSLLTMHVFLSLRELCLIHNLAGNKITGMRKFNHKVYGLTFVR
ncbi:hypothetical protein OROGR_012434 [Orobanche gracilis]